MVKVWCDGTGAVSRTQLLNVVVISVIAIQAGCCCCYSPVLHLFFPYPRELGQPLLHVSVRYLCHAALSVAICVTVLGRVVSIHLPSRSPFVRSQHHMAYIGVDGRMKLLRALIVFVLSCNCQQGEQLPLFVSQNCCLCIRWNVTSEL